MNRRGVSERHDRRAVALIMVLIVLSSLAMIGIPFVTSMMLHDRASQNFAGLVASRAAARAARNHAIARLRETAYPAEWEKEAEALESERPRISLRADGFRPSRRTAFRERRGMVVRRDLGETTRSRRDRRSNDRRRDGGGTPELYSESRRGPSIKTYDEPAELRSELPDKLTLPESAAPDPTALGDPRRVKFRDPGGVTASAEVIDEQGKININTAPPNLIAGVFGVRMLIHPLQLSDTEILLDDTSPFPGDSDPATIDGAVVIVHKQTHQIEAVTYRRKAPNALLDCFRADFLSYSGVEEFPVESLVYDLRGWKVAYHRIWSSRFGGFHPSRLTEFSSVEAMREIAGWQIASLFVSRFRGEGLTLDLLRESGVNPREIEEYGLDRLLFTGDDRVLSEADSRRYELAFDRLTRLRFSRALLRKIEERRGPQVILDLAARLEGAGREEVRKVTEELEAALAADQRGTARIDGKYLKRALGQLGKNYEVGGLETILPEDLEKHRDAFTVNSRVAARWSEPQALQGDISLAESKYDTQVERPSEFNRGTLVRIRSKNAATPPEFNFVEAAGGARAGGVELSFPLLRSYRAFGATIQALQRHPVNVNTASRKVLRAVFTGVQGRDENQIVTPYEADLVAARVIGARPLRSFEDFRRLLDSMAEPSTAGRGNRRAPSDSSGLDPEDVNPLFINAVQPTNYALRASTTGLCFDSGDVYTIESRGILRLPAGREIAQTRFREIVEVSPPGSLFVGLLTQRDFTQGFYLRDPRMGIGFPEYDHQFLLQFPGSRSHLVDSRPLMIRRGALIEPQGDLGSLRLAISKTPDGWPGDLGTEHFDGWWDGYELAHGEPYVVPISIGGGGSSGARGFGRARGRSGGGDGGGGGQMDLTTVPGGIEFWFRMRTYPSVRSEDGLLKLVEGGSDPERNNLSLLYDPSAARVVLRIRDGSLPDPSVVTNRETGQYLQIAARRPLELHTWYHIRVVWDGVFGGGAQLYIDGIPVGEDNLSTELLTSIPAVTPVSTIGVRDASQFPIEGVVRIDSELFEYRRSGSNSLMVRRQMPSTWVQQRMVPQGIDPTGGGSNRFDPREPPRRPPVSPPGGTPPGGTGGSGKADSRNKEQSAGPVVGRPEGGSGGRPLPGPGGAGPRPGGATGPAGQQSTYSTLFDPLRTDMRAPFNRRGSTPSAHSPGARVSLWGYSLPIRRKIRDERGIRRPGQRQNITDFQVTEGDAGNPDRMVWGPGGLRLAEPLPADLTPVDDVLNISDEIHHYIDDVPFVLAQTGGEAATPEEAALQPPVRLGDSGLLQRDIVVPFFRRREEMPRVADGDGPIPRERNRSWNVYFAAHQATGRRAIDYFQSKGVCNVSGVGLCYYEKVQLPGDYTAIQEADACYNESVERGNRRAQLDSSCIEAGNYQTMGLRLVGRYDRATRQIIPLEETDDRRPPEDLPDTDGVPRVVPIVRNGGTMEGRSVLANGAIRGRYPLTGVLEIEGMPTPWEIARGRRDGRGQPLFGPSAPHPDDKVEWLRYHSTMGNLFICHSGRFRGYPAGDRRSKKQLDHEAARSLRLVMELSEGGAGYGDYVTIATEDPNVYEPQVRRVYKTMERDDGRFFISLIAVDRGGNEIRNSPGIYQNTYNLRMEPRLVKFPSWRLPEIGSGSLTLFGEGILSGSAPPGAASRRNYAGRREHEEEDTSGITIDELRRLRNSSIPPQSARRVRFVLAPLPLAYQEGAGLTGVIGAGQGISPGSPREAFIVSISTEPGAPTLFAPGVKEGVCRIGDELFYFENPEAEGGGSAGSGGQGSSQGRAELWRRGRSRNQDQDRPEDRADNSLYSPVMISLSQGGERTLGARFFLTQGFRVTNVRGRFEPEGFARVTDVYPERHNFFETFYYNRFTGGSFTPVLRGQFSSPILGRSNAEGQIYSVTRRIRLIGRALLGTQPQAHSLGEPVELVNYYNITPITGPLTNTGLMVKNARYFSPGGGYVLVDPASPGRPWEIIAHLGPRGEGMLASPRDEDGNGCLRARFGTRVLPIGRGMFAYDLPFRYHDRYESEVESEALAYLQKSFRVPGAFWRTIDWRERPWRGGRERLCDVIVVARLDGSPDWSVPPTNEKGGLYLFERKETATGRSEPFEIGEYADELEIRVYFRYRSGAYQRLQQDIFVEDWKETPILDLLFVEYMKDGAIVRHEELPF